MDKDMASYRSNKYICFAIFMCYGTSEINNGQAECKVISFLLAEERKMALNIKHMVIMSLRL